MRVTTFSDSSQRRRSARVRGLIPPSEACSSVKRFGPSASSLRMRMVHLLPRSVAEYEGCLWRSELVTRLLTDIGRSHFDNVFSASYKP